MTNIYLTFDVDWAGESILSDLLDRLERSGASATFYATHPSRLLQELNDSRWEVGLHPDFREGDHDRVIRDLKSAYPRAIGVRSHLLMTSSPLLALFVEHGLRYETNMHLPFHHGLHPVTRVPGLLSIPYYWSDDTHFRMGRRFDVSELELSEPGLKVLAFHPIHVFMNTTSTEHYEEFRIHTKDPERLLPFVNTTERGVATLFDEILREMAASCGGTVRSLCEQFVP